MVFVAVNAQTDPEARWGANDATPDFVTMLDVVSSVQVARYNHASVELLRRSIADWSKERSATGPLEGYVVEVDFDHVADPAERRALAGLPTAFDLPDADVDRLRDGGRRLLRESPDFRHLLADLATQVRVERDDTLR